MKITDKYILGRFLKILGFALLAAIVVVVIVDTIENIDKFIDRRVPAIKVVYYYILYLPFIIVLTMPVAVLMATMFAVGSIARSQELTVMKATGLSLYRLAAPMLIAGFAISSLMVVFADSVMVPAEDKRNMLKLRLIDRAAPAEAVIRNNLIRPGENGWVLFAKTYDEKRLSGEEILLQKFSENSIAVSIRAAGMFWADSVWILINATERTFEGLTEKEFRHYDTLPAWFLSHTPQTLSYRLKKPRDTGFFELIELIKLKKLMGQDTARDRVELYLKISHPFINFILVIIGIPLAASPKRSGGAVGLGISLIISFLYFVILRAGQSFGYTHALPPALAASIGNLIFLTVGIVLFVKARK